VVNTRVFGPFSGHIPTGGDTEDGRNDARDGSDERAREHDDDDRDRESRKNRAPTKWWEASSFDAMKSR
jgi:hypothetical protein